MAPYQLGIIGRHWWTDHPQVDPKACLFSVILCIFRSGSVVQPPPPHCHATKGVYKMTLTIHALYEIVASKDD